jgi:hypothetical protein
MLIAGVLIGIAIYQFVLVYRRNENIYNHPDLNQFLKWGSDSGRYISLMEDELASDKKIHSAGAFFTESFVFAPTFFRFKWFHFSELCWAYNEVTSHSVNFIPTGETHKVNVCLDDGNQMVLESDGSGDILKHLISMAPFAIFGYSDELRLAWCNDTANFVQNVKHRMHQFFNNPEKFIKDNF